MEQVVDKKLEKDIFEDDINGDAFSIMNAFRKQARKEGWTAEEIAKVLEAAKDGGYAHLIQTLMRHIE